MSTPSSEFVERMLREVSATQGFNKWLGVELIQAGGGKAEICIPIRPEISQHHGFVHGGIIGALADIACAWAAVSAVGDVVTSGITLQFLAPAKGTRLRAVGTVLKAGKRNVSVEARVFAETGNEEPKLVAAGLGMIAATGV
jgi:uncharacterized protein (TIGR00369 family)